MVHVVGVSEMGLSDNPGDLVVTHSLGSCVGVVGWDPYARVGGILHFQLPCRLSVTNHGNVNPLMYGDTGIPAFISAASELGAARHRFQVKLCGGAKVADRSGFFNIGLRNYTLARSLLLERGFPIAAEDVGGESWRTITLEIATGRVTVRTESSEYVI